jgi:hypothetical protein
MIYSNFQYIYPPRPENNIPPSDLNFWDKTNSLMAQPKFNGSNCLLFLRGKDMVVMNRHNNRMSNFNIPTNEVLNLYQSDKWSIFNGELMNKSKKDENNQLFNNKLVLFDLLVDNGDYLIGKSFEYRYNLLKSKFNLTDYNHYSDMISENIFIVKSFDKGFEYLFTEFTKVDMLEGLVLKRKDARLERGNTAKNNTKPQIKCRKQTLNYRY